LKGFSKMARICTVCGKGPQVVNSVSNANNRVKHWVYPNVHAMRYTSNTMNGEVKRGKVCTKCVKSGNVKKVL
jgi:large subunit ribosomal protein L28